MDFCQIEANKDTSYFSMRSIFSYAPMSFPRKEKRLLNCSMDTRSQLASSAGKFETLGSNFSNETRICEAACVLILHFLEVFSSYSPSTVKIEANSSVSSGSLSRDLGSMK